ncbi:MAG: hypothetical protein WCB27_21605 [Thermoguttaceae bacterium]
MLFVLVCAIVCSWLAVKIQRARRQREAVEAIVKLDGFVCYTDKSDSHFSLPKPTWLGSLLGEDIFLEVDYVSLDHCPVHDSDLSWLEMLPGLRRLGLFHTQITDAGLEHLKGLTQLKELWLPDTVTYAGLGTLKNMTALESLNVGRGDPEPDTPPSHVTDRFLGQLAGLSSLQELDLSYAVVTDRGLKHLRGMTKLQTLRLVPQPT